MSSAEYNDKALEMALCNIEHVMVAIDEWHDEKKMTDEAHFVIRNELGMAWSLIDYMYLKQTKGE